MFFHYAYLVYRRKCSSWSNLCIFFIDFGSFCRERWYLHLKQKKSSRYFLSPFAVIEQRGFLYPPILPLYIYNFETVTTDFNSQNSNTNIAKKIMYVFCFDSSHMPLEINLIFSIFILHSSFNGQRKSVSI